jgi:hypothetical protein
VNGPVADYFEVVEGWRAWAVVHDESDAARLRSLYYDATWAVGSAMVASCRRGRRARLRPWRVICPAHSAPAFTCTCGIYATMDPAPVASLLTGFRDFAPAEVARAMGRVALWGDVVQCERGWRASHAYPIDIYVWSPVHGSAAADDLAADLAAYAVPVERVDASGAKAVLETMRNL